MQQWEQPVHLLILFDSELLSRSSKATILKSDPYFGALAEMFLLRTRVEIRTIPERIHWLSSCTYAADQVEDAVEHALKVGYRHIDCADAYGNHDEVGKAFKKVFGEGKVKREDVWITTKLNNPDHEPSGVSLYFSLTLLASKEHLALIIGMFSFWEFDNPQVNASLVRRPLFSLLPCCTIWVPMMKSVPSFSM